MFFPIYYQLPVLGKYNYKSDLLPTQKFASTKYRKEREQSRY